jgi:hypothetical protein
MENELRNRAGRPAMRLRRGVYAALAVLSLFAGASLPSHAEDAGHATRPSLAVLPFEIEDTSGEVGPANRHDAMLGRLTSVVGEQIAASKLYDVVPEAQVREAVGAVNSGTFLRRCNGCEVDIAKRVGARYVLIGWIYKVSTLVLTLHIDIKDVTTGKPIYARVFDFRGDNERAYQHAAKIFVRSLVSETPAPTN